MAQVGTVLERYDASVVATVTSPLTGIQRKCKFPPSIAEIVEECDRVVEDGARYSRPNRWEGLVPRRVEHPPMNPGEDYDSMVAKYGRPIGYFE